VKLPKSRFLLQNPDVLGRLQDQADTVADVLIALAGWARVGTAAAAFDMLHEALDLVPRNDAASRADAAVSPDLVRRLQDLLNAHIRCATRGTEAPDGLTYPQAGGGDWYGTAACPTGGLTGSGRCDLAR